MEEVKEVQDKLAAVKARISEILTRIRDRHGPELKQEYWSARNLALDFERRVAELKGEQYAVPLEFPVQWDTGAPLPHLLANDYRAYLTFFVRVDDPNWDGTYVTIQDPANAACEPIAVVEFERCIDARLGGPNDEVLHGHPLSSRGLEPYSAQIVVNSPRLSELQKISSVHSGYNPERWKNRKHYVFWFHDSTFECIAESFRVEVFNEPMAEVLQGIMRKLIGTE